MATRWKAVTNPPLLWREWNGEFVVYNDVTGDTHQMDATSAAILRSLEDASADAEAIHAQVVAQAQHDGLDPDRAQAAIDQFRLLGLIEPADE